ncbi:MAG: hypothetical protein JSV42_16710 [Chloroflexota bacterium]|nr:MAG: hypothetical protein JSV42_16710 [Chloroflexota bacterium]
MNPEPDQDDIQATAQHITSVMKNYEGELLSKPNVVGVAVGFRHKDGKPTGSLALVVMVDRKLPESLLSPEERIPEMIEDVPVDVQEIGEISAY